MSTFKTYQYNAQKKVFIELSNETKHEGDVFVLESRYKPLKQLGFGAYGTVISAFDEETKKDVAIKKIPGDVLQQGEEAIRIYREVKILQYLNHPHILKLERICQSPTEQLKDWYFSTELLDTDLGAVIRRCPLDEVQISHITYQLLRALQQMESAKIAHRDLKPENIFVSLSSCQVKIGDWGLARALDAPEEEQAHYTEVVVTLNYRAPEVCVTNGNYSTALDMWSIGCILAQMCTKRVLFAGENLREVLESIGGTLGVTKEDLQMATVRGTRPILEKYLGRRSTLKKRLWSVNSEKAIDLISKMLVFNPSDRISVSDALAHPFITQFNEENDEAQVPNPSDAFDSSFEQVPLNNITELLKLELETQETPVDKRRGTV
eukprot:TRINITY_DN34969_c0_g2_i1.p2 TRINITY_DN34969_c0_g2~~TRINITY_DN34969_c0_g2_i1.p2  ORF type:complete len:379 (+),score=100.27 TRINITY_DN34969_c0_g2_i1:100-1236(+)